MFGISRHAGRVVPGTGHAVTVWVYEPDRWAVQAASLGVATNTVSPMAYGVHGPLDAGHMGYTGDLGYGVNRASGRTPYAVQNFSGAVAPVTNPKTPRLGFGTGTSGQPGLPSTGQATGGSPFGYPGSVGMGA